jgi:uncharacterized protein
MFNIDILKILEETVLIFLKMAPYLLIGMFFAGLLHVFFKKEMIVRHVGKNDFWSVFKAAMFGVPLPLCSCGVIPSSVFLKKNGASKGAVISFLISTPQTGIDSIIATYGMMGWIFAIYRPFAALVMGIVGGTVINLVKDKQDLRNPTLKGGVDMVGDVEDEDSLVYRNPSIWSKLKSMFSYSFVEFLDDISVQFLVGVLISGLISYFIPENFFMNTSVNSGLLGMLMMAAVGVPMYVCATASIPIALTLMMKGFSPGVAFVFLVTGPATNAASLAILTKILGKKIVTLYVAVIVICAIAFGFLLDQIFTFTGSSMTSMLHHHHEESPLDDPITMILGIAFFILILLSLYRKFLKNRLFPTEKKMIEQTVQKININGMTCNHCVMNVKQAILKNPGIRSIEVSLADKAAFLEGDFDMESVKKSIESVGYEVV